MLNATAAMAHSPTTPLAPAGQAQAGHDDGQAFAQALDQAAARQRDVAGEPAEPTARESTGPRPEAPTRGKAGTARSRAEIAAEDPADVPAEPLLPLGLADEAGSQIGPDEPAQPPPDLAAWASNLPQPRPAPAATNAAPAVGAEDTHAAATARMLDAVGGPGRSKDATPPQGATRSARDLRAAPPSLVEAAATGGGRLPPADAMAQAGAVQRPGLDAGTATPPTLPGPWAQAAGRAVENLMPAQVELKAPPGSNEFAPALGSQLSVMVRDGIDHAQLKLNPADMGPIEVRIRLDGTQAQVDFSAAHAVTRQALQDALPTLAGALRENGLTLTGGGVFEQTREQRGDTHQDGSRGSHDGRGHPSDATALTASAARSPRARGVVDLYA